jgi:tRNA threonylcarbamoyl adenosine modification protein YeaZ
VLILAFDTATPAVTVAVHDGVQVVAEESAVDARRHGELLSVFIDRALRRAGATPASLTAIAVGTGPGPYTGLRTGLVTARVLGATLDVPVDGICTLDVIATSAAGAAGGREFLVATDARRKELYWARYSAFGQRVTGPKVSPAADLPAGLPVAGEGARLYPELVEQALEPAYPSAAWLAALAAERIAAGMPPAPPQPLYLRRPDAREPGRPKRVTP